MATPPLSSVSTHHRAPPPWPPPKTASSPRTSFLCGVLAPPASQVLEAVGKRLVLAYLKCGDLGSARTVFDEMPPQVADVRVWTSLMSAYAKAGDFHEGVSLFRQMQCCGVSPDAHVVSCVLKCTASLGSIVEGEVIHGLLEKLGLGEACAVANALIALYSRCGRMEDAMKVFDSMHPRDAISWNSMISGCFSNGWHDKAIDLFSKMWSEGTETSSVTVLSVLPACAELGYELVGKAVHGYSVKSGLLWDLDSVQSGIGDVVGSKLVFMYVKCGDMGSARRVFDAMSSKGNVHVWNLIMGGYAKAGDFEESLSLFEQMHELGIVRCNLLQPPPFLSQEAARRVRLQLAMPLQCRSMAIGH